MEEWREAAIEMTEAAYDLEVADSEWFPQILTRGLPLIDRGFGVAGFVGKRSPPSGAVEIETMHVASGPVDFPSHLLRVLAELPPERLSKQVKAGVQLLSERIEYDPTLLDAWKRHIDYAKDALGITALDTDGRGVQIVSLLPDATQIRPRTRRQWRMITAHLSAGLRLRRALHQADSQTEHGDLPFGADALIDPSVFEVTDASPAAQTPNAREVLRDAAMRIDRARARLRKHDAAEALAIWCALIRGRWSLVDWFDTDGRRYMIALQNAPTISDSRGLTEREAQVTGYAALGESHKMIAYRLGISRSRVTTLLRSAMRKLSVRTQAELVAKMRLFATHEDRAP